MYYIGFPDLGVVFRAVIVIMNMAVGTVPFAGYKRGRTMIASEIREATERCKIRLVLNEQEQGTEQEDTESGIQIRRLKRPTVRESCIHFQRCGGGYRVIRRQMGRGY